jgi:tetratricopeptide (TPR) repeat protein
LQNIDLLFQKAKESYQKNDFAIAEKLLNEYLETQENNAEAYFLLSNIYHMKGQIGKAIRGFKKVLQLDPAHTDASISLSVVLNDIGKYEEAKKIFDSANSNLVKKQEGLADPHINRKFAFKHFELAEMYFTYNRYEEALYEYNKASSLEPENVEYKIKIAKVYAKKGYSSKACEVLRQVKREYPGATKARIALGLIYYGIGNVIEAQTEWQAILQKEPDNQEAHMYLKLSRQAKETNLAPSQSQVHLS